MSLDIISPIPLHVQLKELLKENIFRGHFIGKIPSEKELMETYSISRTTVREAVEALVYEGILQKRHGKGTFIAAHPVQDWLGSLKSYTETVESLGMKPGAKLIAHGPQKVCSNIAEKMGSDNLYSIERLRFANNKPLAIERKFLPIDLGLYLSKYDLDDAHIYEILEKEMGIILWESDMMITASTANKEDAKLLDISRNIGVLITERTTIDGTGRKIEYNKSLFRADVYAFHIKQTRKTGRV